MKLFFSLILLFIFLNTSAQDCSDSVSVSICISSGTETSIYKTIGHFDSYRNATSRYIYRQENGVWKKFYGYLYSYVYDTSGNILDYIYQSVSGYMAPENEVHETYVFDSASNRIENSNYLWSAGEWNNYRRYHYYPDTAGNDTLTFVESGVNGTWQNLERTYSEFNADHVSVHDSTQNWNSSTLQWWLYKDVYRFSNGTIDSAIQITYNTAGNISYMSYGLSYFDSSILANIQIGYYWSGTQWMFGGSDTTFYDQAGHLISTDPNNGDYFTYQYDSLGNLIQETYNGAGASYGVTNYSYVGTVLRSTHGTSSSQGGLTSVWNCDYRYADIDGSYFSCGNDSSQLVAQPCSAGHQFLWSTGETSASITADTSSDYTVTVTYPGGFTDSSFAFHTVPSPSATITLPFDTTICITQNILLNADTGFSFYIWQDSSTSSSFLATSLVPDTILFSVFVSDSVGCTASDTMQIIFDACMGYASDNNLNSKLNLFPNPAKNQFTVSSWQFANSELEIFNSFGEKIYSSPFDQQQKINSENFPKGIYFVRVTNDESVVTKKVLIE